MKLRYDEIGRRLRAFRLGAGLTAEEISQRVGISRTAVYRFEKGEVVKIETLSSLAELFGVSLASLLGVEIEYISSAVTYFERLRQLEENADRILNMAGPIAFLLASDRFRALLRDVLVESVEAGPDPALHLPNVDRIAAILDERREIYLARRPGIVNLISALDIERMLRAGFVGKPFVSDAVRAERRAVARAEIEHFARLLASEPIGVQIGVVTQTLPHTVFHIFRTGDRKTLAISPFRLGEQPNISLGVAMVTASPEAIQLHERMIDKMWSTALKGTDAATCLHRILTAENEAPTRR